MRRSLLTCVLFSALALSASSARAADLQSHAYPALALRSEPVSQWVDVLFYVDASAQGPFNRYFVSVNSEPRGVWTPALSCVVSCLHQHRAFSARVGTGSEQFNIYSGIGVSVTEASTLLSSRDATLFVVSWNLGLQYRYSDAITFGLQAESIRYDQNTAALGQLSVSPHYEHRILARLSIKDALQRFILNEKPASVPPVVTPIVTPPGPRPLPPPR